MRIMRCFCVCLICRVRKCCWWSFCMLLRKLGWWRRLIVGWFLIWLSCLLSIVLRGIRLSCLFICLVWVCKILVCCFGLGWCWRLCVCCWSCWCFRLVKLMLLVIWSRLSNWFRVWLFCIVRWWLVSLVVCWICLMCWSIWLCNLLRLMVFLFRILIRWKIRRFLRVWLLNCMNSRSLVLFFLLRVLVFLLFCGKLVLFIFRVIICRGWVRWWIMIFFWEMNEEWVFWVFVVFLFYWFGLWLLGW